MIYIKTNITDDIEVKVNLDGSEFFSNCPDCGDEVQIEPEYLAAVIGESADFAGTSVCCSACTMAKLRP